MKITWVHCFILVALLSAASVVSYVVYKPQEHTESARITPLPLVETPEEIPVVKDETDVIELPEEKVADVKVDPNAPEGGFLAHGEPFFKSYCYSCHGDFASDESIVKDRETWELILELVETEEMPTKKPLPDALERDAFVDWLHGKLDEVDWSEVKYAGYVALPLLNKKEYNNTIRDLLGVDIGAGDKLFADGEGESGFTTDRSNLFLSPASFEKYLEAAENAVAALEEGGEGSIITENSLDKILQAEDMLSTGGIKGQVKGATVMRLTIGQTTVYDSFTVPADGDYTFELRGTSFNNDNASIRVTIGDELVGNLTFPGDDYTIQKLTVYLNRGTHQMNFNKGTDANKRTDKNGVRTFHKESDLDWVKITSAGNITKVKKQKPLYVLKPIRGIPEIESVKKTLRHFLLRSFRRPVEEDVLQKYLGLYSELRKQGGGYTFSLKQAMVSILVSPRFLYRYELDPALNTEQEEYELDHFQIASRLSYFLWLSMPDAELFQLASEKKLRDPEVLKQQVKRMLADPKSRDFSETFLGQWLGFEALGNEVVPDSETFPEFDSQLARAMKSETVMTFEHLIEKDYSVLTLIDSKATFLNERLAKHYKIKGVEGSHMRPVGLEDANRGGLLGMGSILTATSSPTRTSPVLRGIWVLEKMLGERIPEAPADVPEIDPNIDQQKSTTLRKELEQHRLDPTCARCHDKIDPIGFGLENFDALGRFRTKEASGNPIDSSGEMDGDQFTGAAELKKWILKNRKEEFVRTVSEKMLAFALGRKVEPFDERAVNKITNELEENDYKASILIQEVVVSYPFLNRSLNNEIKIHE